MGRPGHTITFTSWELEALLRCLEALIDGHELKATAQTLHTKVVESATTTDECAQQSRQAKAVRDRTEKAKKSGMNVVPKE